VVKGNRFKYLKNITTAYSLKMTLEKTALGTIEYDARIENCINKVYKGAYTDGQHKGKPVILKYTEKADKEAMLIEAVADSGIETPTVLESTSNYLVMEYKEMKNLAFYVDSINPEKIAKEVAGFHAKLYENRTKLEDKIIIEMTEKERTLEKISRFAKEHAIYRAARALWSSFTSSVSRYSFDKYIENLLSQLPDNEGVFHRDLSDKNIITNGAEMNFIDFFFLGKTCFANDVAKLALSLKSVGSFDEKSYLDSYYTELDRLIGKEINKSKDKFLQEYKAAKILTGLSYAPVFVKCKKDPNRQNVYERLDPFLHSALDVMNKKERETILSFLLNNDNEYVQEIFNSINRWRTQNQPKTRIWLDDIKRTAFRNLTPLQATAAVSILAASIAYGYYTVSKYLREHPDYAKKAECLLNDVKKISAETDEFDKKMRMCEKKLKEAYPLEENNDKDLDEIIDDGLK